ncbi:hypothetical protein TcWFU_008585 [Taenia crassiceps]|uniref:CEP170 C-terminal domain-containing protein n=1 Tax=Taenia crassiceps TaxID=6207 RepID=A0ABR4QI93_9CEST
MERRRKVTEELISQIEGCLTERLLREQLSDLYHPIPALVPQISGPSSVRTICSSTSESFKKVPSDSPNFALENIPPVNKNSLQTLFKGAKTNHLNEGSDHDKADRSNTGELPPYTSKAANVESNVNWRLLQQIRSRNTSKFTQPGERKCLPSGSHASPLGEARYWDKSPPLVSSTSTAKSPLIRPSVGESRGWLTQEARSRTRWVKSPDKAISESLGKKEAAERGERRSSQLRRNLHESQVMTKSRTQKPLECLSERQLNGYRSLQRRLEYDPRASVAKERLKSKLWENRNNDADESYTTPTSNRDGEVGGSTKVKATLRQFSIDSKVQSTSEQRNFKGQSRASNSPAPRNQNSRIVGTGRDASNRSATTSPFHRTRSDRRRRKPKEALANVETSNQHLDAAVEAISQKLERLAKHVVHLRRLVERDYSEVGYCSPGDDIYADEEVGAVNNGKPTGMHPSIADSLRSIRLLEANVQEIFDLLYLNEAQVWSPTGSGNE